MAANPRQRYTAEQALRSTFLRDEHDEIHENESSLYNTMVLGASVWLSTMILITKYVKFWTSWVSFSPDPH